MTERIAGRRVIASISGGKDSAALSLHLRELGIEHDRVFMDTGWEHPATYDYLRGELTRVLGPITEIKNDLQMVDLILKKGMFPARKQRFCTQELKLKPMRAYLSALNFDHVNAVGIRRAESQARSAAPEWEWSDSFDCDVWRPLILWTEQQVIDIHKRHGLAPNPLYLLGAQRVGCWPCIHTRKAEVKLVADKTPERIDQIRDLEAEVTRRAQERYAQKGETLTYRRGFFRGPTGTSGECWAIDDVVAWSRTSRGGVQYEMFATDPADEGCMRWGMCDSIPSVGDPP